MHQAKSNNFEKEIMEAFRAFDHTGSCNTLAMLYDLTATRVVKVGDDVGVKVI
jgi:hypothetical protein